MDTDIKSKILQFANNHAAIRAVILNGSRANPNIVPDKYQDFDVMFLVNDLAAFSDKTLWYHFLGTPILEQLPHQMQLGNDDITHTSSTPSYLMIFEDGSRVDLTIFTIAEFLAQTKFDSLSVVWLDKDHVLPPFTPDESDYWVQKPTQRQFNEVSNEFWWVATYVAKGLARNQFIYAQEMLNTIVRPMFLQLIYWQVGVSHDFKVNVGKSGKFLPNLLSPNDYKQVLATYADADLENNWQALFAMLELFFQKQIELAKQLDFTFNQTEAKNALAYMLKIKNEQI